MRTSFAKSVDSSAHLQSLLRKRRKKPLRDLHNRRRLFWEKLEDRALLAGDVGLPAPVELLESAAEGEGEIVRFRVETTDLVGSPVSSVDVGEEFFVRVYAQDLRASAQGVASAHVDLAYDDALVTLDGALSAGAEYSTDFSGDTSVAGLIDEAGGISLSGPLGADAQLVFSARFTADAAGEVQFAADPADLSPLNDVLLFGQALAVADADIEYGAASLTITESGLPFFEDFDAGTAADFTVQVGDFDLTGGAYVSAPALGGEAVSTIELEGDLPLEYMIEATANASASSGGFWSNAFIVFDVQSATEFKYAGAYIGRGQWAIGQHTAAAGFVDLATFNEPISANQDLDLKVVVQGGNAQLLVNGSAKVSHFFGESLADGAVGLAVDNAITTFDDVSITASAVAQIPPVAADDTVSTSVDAAVDISVTANDGDPNGDSFSVISVTQGANGSVAINPDDTLTYTPNVSFTGTDTFTYTIADNDGSATANVTVFVNAENEAPIAIDDDVMIDEDTTVTVDVLANDTDDDGDALAVISFTQAANGTVAVDGDGMLVYEPDANFNGSDSFTYTISDGHGAFATGTVTVDIEAVVDAPLAVDDVVSVSEDLSVDIDVLTNDETGDAGSLMITTVTQGANGSVTANVDGTITYTPDSGFIGTDTFTYTIDDGAGGMDEGAVTVFVETGALAALRLEATDLSGNPISVVQAGEEFLLQAYVQDVSAAGQGVLAGYFDIAFDSALATVTGMVDFGAEFTNDLSSDLSVAGLINEVGGAGDATASGGAEQLLFSLQLSADAAGHLSFTSSAADLPAHDVLLYGRTTAITSAEIDFGETSLTVIDETGLPFFEDFNDGMADNFLFLSDAFDVSGNAFVSAPNPGENAVSVVDLNVALPDDFMIQATANAEPGSAGGFWSNAFIIFDVQSATNFKYAGAFVGRGEWVIGQHTAAGGFVDLAVFSEPIPTNTDLDLKVNIDGDDATLLVNGSAKVSHSFGDSLADGLVGVAVQNAITTFDDVSIMANATVQLPPIANDDSVSTNFDTAVDIDVTANDSDPNGDAFTVISATQGANGSVAINPDDTLTYTPGVSFTGTDTFTYTIADNDGTATATVHVEVSADAEVDLPFFEDFDDGVAADFAVQVGAFDLTGGAFVSAPSSGGNAAATIDLDVPLPDDFMIQATVNANAGSATGFWSNAFIIFDVQSATNFKYAGAFLGRSDWVIGQHTAASGFVDLAAASEPIPANTDLDLKVNVEGDDATLLVNGSAKVSHSFGESLADGEVGVAVQNAITTFDDVSIMASVETGLPPVAEVDFVGTTVDTEVDIDVTANDSDPDGDAFGVVSVTQGANGSVAINVDDTLTYTPDEGFIGVDTFSYTIADVDGSATANVVVIVSPIGGGLPFFEDFDDGAAADFTVQVGAFDLTGDAYVSAPSLGGNAAATIDVGAALPDDFMIEATVNAAASAGGFWSNAFIIFDVQSTTDFKYAGAFLGRGQWVIGQHTSASGFVDLAVSNEPIPANTDLDLKVNIEGDDATLLVNGSTKVSHSFGESLADGEVGVAVQNAITSYGNVRIRATDEVFAEIGG